MRYIYWDQGEIMKNPLKQLDSRVMLSGKNILSSISTMGEFGDLADAVLEKYGIKYIDENE